MIKVKFYITLKSSILDPQGRTLERSLLNLNHQVNNVRIGKCIELEIEKTENFEEKLKEIASILGNPIMEEVSWEVE